MSDDLPGFNSPRRKARFGAQYEDDLYRRRAPSKPGATEPTQEAEPTSEPEPAPDEPLPAQDDGAAEPELATAPGGEAEATDDLLPNFRLTHVYEPPPPPLSPFKDWRWLLGMAALLAVGLGGGYRLGQAHAPAVKVMKSEAKPVIDGLTPERQAQVDAAFDATKKGRFQEASEQFAALRKDHPEWWSMGIEAARASLYLHDPQATQRALQEVTAPEALPDVNFIMALLHLTSRELTLAEDSFASAAARDPARADFYYFWGECLRRDGKPLEAAAKFRSAILRNQYENAEGLYQTKLWLSQIQADAADSSGANKEIDAALVSARPPYEAFFAAAARELKAKRYPQAVQFLTRAVPITEPAVFRVIMQDPTFIEEANAHVEFAPFYQ